MINIRMHNQEVQKLSPKITVVGVGGAGGNAVNNMISTGLEGCEFLVCNTDAQALEGSLSLNKLQLGLNVTGGLGAGAKPEIGRMAAEESIEEVMQFLDGSNMVFITAGMGGGTGTGAAPVIAKAARDRGILTVGVVTKPFHFEGTTRMRMADAGIEQMQNFVDTLLVIPNQNLFRVANEKTTFADAFRMADSVLQSGVRGVTDLMIMPGLINLDFADIRSAMLEMGKAMMGTGEASGDRRAVEAAEKAINNPLLDDVSMKGARGVIINVIGGNDLTLFEVDEACNRIREEVDPNANIIVGSTFDPKLDGAMRVSVVATGIDAAEAKARRPQAGASVINSVTSQQQDRKLDRAVPPVRQAQAEADVWAAPAATHAPQTNTQSVFSAPAQPVAPQQQQTVAAPVAPQVNTQASAYHMPPKFAPSHAPRTAAQASVMREEEQDLFSQPVVNTAVVEASVMQQVAQPSVQNTVAQPVAAQRPQPHNMRGEVMGESFIPPQAIEPAGKAPVYVDPADFSSLAATRPVAEPAASGLNLRPPMPGSSPYGQQPKKKSPSLFERLSGPLRHHGEQGSAIGGEAAPAQAERADESRQAQRPVQQPSLAIDAPLSGRTDGFADDELDIPAFLRRQAN
jgi:cell division protein FtsZ